MFFVDSFHLSDIEDIDIIASRYKNVQKDTAYWKE